jgi:hypothetical protein
LGKHGVFKKTKPPKHTNTRDSWRRNCHWDQREGFLEMKLSLGKLSNHLEEKCPWAKRMTMLLAEG